MKSWLMVLALGLGGAATAACQSEGTKAQAHKMVEQGALLVDVRSVEEFNGGHLKGALNVPVQTLPGRLAELGAKDKPMVVYCASGGRSAHAARVLKAAGFTNVLDLGGMSNW
jgi:rhodanese-related sulfurtransferase